MITNRNCNDIPNIMSPTGHLAVPKQGSNKKSNRNRASENQANTPDFSLTWSTNFITTNFNQTNFNTKPVTSQH